jgi:hypothetical protein
LFLGILRAEWVPLFYRYFVFGAFAGRMRLSFLPLFCFWGFCGQNEDLSFTAISFLGFLRAEWVPLFYHYFVFGAFTGRMRLSFLPQFRF